METCTSGSGLGRGVKLPPPTPRGSGPNTAPDWRGDPWYVYRAGICDADGVYYSMLYEGCLEDIREENARRPQTDRDAVAREVTELLGDDLDGAQSMMDDLNLG